MHNQDGSGAEQGNLLSAYVYDAFGRRIAKTNGLTRTEFLWQGDRLIAEETGDQYRTYVYEPDTFKPLALVEGFGKENANTYYYHLDHLGTPQEITNAQGDLVWSVTYRAYGNVVRALVQDIDNPLRFQGQYHDPETGLHYNRHRYYNPNTGRFLTPDPIGLAGGLNNYQYVTNPTGWVDPLGLAARPKNGPESDSNGDSDGGVAGARDEGPEVPESEPVTKKVDDFVDLTEHRKEHILNRHRAGAGKPGKTEFPPGWSDDQILHHVSDIATDPQATRGLGKWDSPYAIGTRDGVEMRVDFYPNSHPKYAGKISTAYPINGTPNP